MCTIECFCALSELACALLRSDNEQHICSFSSLSQTQRRRAVFFLIQRQLCFFFCTTLTPFAAQVHPRILPPHVAASVAILSTPPTDTHAFITAPALCVGRVTTDEKLLAWTFLLGFKYIFYCVCDLL